MAHDPEHFAHIEWLGYVQPSGLVVSPPALAAAQAHPNRNIAPVQAKFLAHLREVALDGASAPVLVIADLPSLMVDLFQWRSTDLAGSPGGPPIPDTLEVVLPDYGEILKPTWAVAEPEPAEGEQPWQLLIQNLPTGTDPDAPSGGAHGWRASPQARFERLLRETRVPTGLLCNGTSLRLVYAPRGESSGHITFPVRAMAEVAGRPILAALHMLLEDSRLFTDQKTRRLPAILADSRRYQNVVSERLAEQVLAALYELLRGFQAAHDASGKALLADRLAEKPDDIYAGLLTVLMRLIFLLYAEDRGLVSTDPVYVNHYAVTGLFTRLREDSGRYPDTMDQRYGAWAGLLALFRLLHDGGRHGTLRLPARHGGLFSPDRYPFLEGRGDPSLRVMGARATPPAVADGVIWRVLLKLMILDGERISYRSLDVEQIGSVYETMMGFSLRVAAGRTLAIRPGKSGGAPAPVDLDAMLAVAGSERGKWLKERADQDLTGEAAEKLTAASRVEELAEALDKKIAREATPRVVPAGTMLLQPTDERRRSGSHYTPRVLTTPIVETTLRPILAALGASPAPAEILALKVCDPAMGSGAFLVEACRQLAEALLVSWRTHGGMPPLPPDEDDVLLARRTVARRCLYGVDRNPLAADLARLSLWLATLAKDHPFTFLDHALRSGDSLVGLSRRQIEAFHWAPSAQSEIVASFIAGKLNEASGLREKIHAADEGIPDATLRMDLMEADEAVADVRLVGDLAVGAFFAGGKPKVREKERVTLAEKVRQWKASDSPALRNELSGLAAGLREEEKHLHPFHWEVEFPEVFGRENPGFDAIVGNPPFMGGSKISSTLGASYLDWVLTLHEQAHGNGDIVAHFFRRAFTFIRKGGAFGLIATNTIAQGDTRSTGLRWIGTHGGTIYSARRRYKWPGRAAVVVSVVHVTKGEMPGPYLLDGHAVPTITAYLFHAGGHEDPVHLQSNASRSFLGAKTTGLGFIFDDTDKKGVASSLAEMRRLIEKDSRNAERIFPYIGGEEVNDSPTHAHQRYVINFGEMTEAEALQWPDLLAIVEMKVKPERARLANNPDGRRRSQYWWQYGRYTPGLFAAIRGMDRVLVLSRLSQYMGFALLPTGTVFSERLVVFALDRYSAFAALQSRVHEGWGLFFGSTFEERPMYAPSDCFETFPFPDGYATDSRLEAVGREYYDFRAALMVRNYEGLTKTYNRFHDRDERAADILRLRELHAAMDAAVLTAYGWDDLTPRSDFFLEYDDAADEEPGQPARAGRGRKKPWRYRWPDDLRDEVLARLLALNARRAEMEKLAGAALKVAEPGATKKRSRKGRKDEKTGDLYG